MAATFVVFLGRVPSAAWLGALAGRCLAIIVVCLGALLDSGAADAAAKSHAKTPAKAALRKAKAAEPKPVPVLSRREILASDPQRLERIGRHVVVGYHAFSDVKALVEKKAIAGIFITDHNVRRSTAAAIKSQVDVLQKIRKSQDLPPLLVAADQEGGPVSRLSPPLKRQTSLGRVLAGLRDDEARRKAVERFAAVQAAELKRMGVSLNFAPVVDLKFGSNAVRDGETRLRQRVIGSDPYLVAKVAGWYCDGLAKAGLMCTLKHFPGLGRVQRDTHVTMGEITASEGALELNDWYPFRQLMNRPNVVTMLGHVRVRAVDATAPASYSDVIIGKLIRGRWRHEGLLITDDFSMGAVTRSSGGVGAAAVKALNAGADLVLVSFSEKHYDAVMSALLRADADGAFASPTLAASRDRIGKTLTEIEAAPR
ncbi:MAG: glycoside hydrolase family 3 N-terminal domain-containing protein [Hyphomicrobium sp.]